MDTFKNIFGFHGGTIEFQQLSVDLGIKKIKNIKADLISKKPIFPEKEGSGDVADEVEMIGQTYEKTYEAMLLLFDNTISFLDNAQKSLVSKDKALADSIKK